MSTVAPSFETLKPILEKFGHWKGDPLSLRLERWGKKVDASNFDSYLLKLRSKILLNPLDSSLRLKRPILDRKWIWEACFLEEYAAASEIPVLSPFDGKAMHVEPHLFAQSLLTWANPEENEVRTVAKVSRALLQDAETTKKTKVAFTLLAQRFVQQERWREETRLLKAESRALTFTIAASESHALVLKKQNEKATVRFESTLSGSAIAIKDVLNAATTMHRSVVSDQENNLLKAQQDLDRTKQLSNSQQNRIAALKQERMEIG